MTCPNCGHPNRESAKFCEECGIVLPSGASTASRSPTATAAPRAQNMAPRRVEPFRASSPSAKTSDAQPSGTTMLNTMESGHTERIFGIVVLVIVLLLCCCCGTAAVVFYWLTQNTSGTSLIGIM